MLRLFAVALCAVLSASAQNNAALEAAIAARLKTANAQVSLYAKNLNTGVTFSLRGDDPVRTASTIKLPIMIECFFEASQKKLQLTDQIELIENEKVNGSGILQELSSGIKLPLRDMIDLMIVLSDNTATNLILNRIGGDAVNDRMASLGLTHTRVMRKIMRDEPSGITHEGAKPENKPWGLGRTSPHEMVTLLEKLHDGQIVDKPSSDAMLAILKHQRDRNGIARDLRDVTVANKSGALDQLRSDAGIVYTKNCDIAMDITVDGIPEANWTPENPGLLLISDLSAILIDGLSKH